MTYRSREGRFSGTTFLDALPNRSPLSSTRAALAASMKRFDWAVSSGSGLGDALCDRLKGDE
ncbi:MAG TPA: hypothetical protein VG939_07260 [Caulobacteraceae bacterium]|nr:hypothetical protein [Caulobacteraceae bacterium]